MFSAGMEGTPAGTALTRSRRCRQGDGHAGPAGLRPKSVSRSWIRLATVHRESAVDAAAAWADEPKVATV